MRYDSPIESLAKAVVLATSRDLPFIEYRTNPRMEEDRKAKNKIRRPYDEDIDVIHFSQMWGSTALGFGGMGGAAMTTAYTTVVKCDKTLTAAVYFAGRLAYLFPYREEKMALSFRDYLSRRRMPDIYEYNKLINNNKL